VRHGTYLPVDQDARILRRQWTRDVLREFIFGPRRRIWTSESGVNGVVLELEARRRLRIRWKLGAILSWCQLHKRWVFVTILDHLGQIIDARI
jgi:hypothetical protein